MTDKMFWGGIDYTNPTFTAAAQCVPAPDSWGTMTIGGPREPARVRAEIVACARTMECLRAELAALERHADSAGGSDNGRS